MDGIFKVGVFDDEEKLISALQDLVDKGISIHEVFTPYPIHRVISILKRKSLLPTAALIYGLTGALAVLAFLYYTSVISWPIVYGGKPFNTFPSFIVITIIMTIFIVTIASLGTFSARSKLIPGNENPVFDERGTGDKFIIVLSNSEVDNTQLKEAADILKHGGAIEIVDKSFE
ncbi:MAG: DUF3341 domain-containing protein [Bacteroidota bacterium]